MRPGVRSLLSQVRCCSAELCVSLGQGLVLGWTSPALAKLRAGQGPFQPTLQELSWIASVFDLGLLVGVVASAVVFSRLGRRQTALAGPLCLCGWSALTYLGSSAVVLCCARLLAGVGQGASMSFTGIYIGEVTTASVRGALVLAVMMLLAGGMLLSYWLGPLVSLRTHSLLPAPLALLALVTFALCMEESPYYWAARGRPDRVLRVLRAVRGGADPEEVAREAQSITRAVSEQLHCAGTLREAFAVPGCKRAAAIVLVLCGCLALTGIVCVLVYTMQIFKAIGSPVAPETCAFLFAALKVGAVPLAMVAVERVGRRVQLFSTAMVNFVALGSVSAFFLARDQLQWDVAALAWVPTVALLVYIVACSLGVNAVPHVLISELLSQRTKAVVAPVAMILLSTSAFVLNKTFLPIVESIGFYLPFACFAVVNLLLALFTLAMVPETKGRTLIQVQQLLAGGRARASARARDSYGLHAQHLEETEAL